MIDIHSHILYDIDDGSESLDMSLQMLRMSVDSGVTDIIATPHVNRQGHIPSWQTILDKAAALQEEADKANIPILQIAPRGYSPIGGKFLLDQIKKEAGQVFNN